MSSFDYFGEQNPPKISLKYKLIIFGLALFIFFIQNL